MSSELFPLGSEKAFAAAIQANPDFLGRTVLDALVDSIEQQKTRDLLDAGLSPTFADDVNGPWEMLLGRIARYVAGGPPNDLPNPSDPFSRSIQLVTVPTAATWDDTKYGPYQLCKILGDSMPKWLPTYAPAGGNSFGDGYGIFIQSISIPAPTDAQQKEIDAARSEWQVALQQIRTRESKVGERWVDFDKQQVGVPPARRLTYDQYYSKYELPVLSSLRRALQGKQQKFTKKINDYTRGFGLVADMIARYSSESAMFQTPGQGTGDDALQNVYRYSVDQNLTDFKARAATQPDNAISWEFNKSSFRLSASSSYWGGSASYGFFARGGAGGSSSHLDWHNDTFKLIFKAKAIEKFTITPGDWYTGQLIKLFKDGPFVPGSGADIAYKAHNLWAPSGILALRSSTLVLVYEPSIEITITKEDYNKDASSWSTSGGLSIGCFSFGANAGGSKEDITYDSASSTIRARDTTGIPKIIAVNNDVLPNLS